MPVNYVQIQSELKKIGELAPQRQKQHEALLSQVLETFKEAAQDPQGLKDRYLSCYTLVNELRSAIPPEKETLDAAVDATPTSRSYTVWAADGSQIIPNQHFAIQFGLINVGLIRFAGSDVPVQEIETRLLYDTDLYTSQGYLIGEEIIALRRDYRERELLLQKAKNETNTVITLTDGPLELYREPKESEEYTKLIHNYQEILHQMADQNVLTAGYVDKPQGDLLTRLLELYILPPDQLKEAGKTRPFIGITDVEIFSQLLKPGQRSAVFQVQSPTTFKYFQNDLAIYFFYLNVSTYQKPQLARVEIPRWVSQNPDYLNLLHTYLLAQCEQMGPRAYPYVLHRAHEIAVVSQKERQHLEMKIQQELLNQGLDLAYKSGKQIAKDQPQRMR
ncbi:MAG: hypothetical protein CL609_16980 [Anaerolineaceae bacterium]|nr:hypothetical protein [Anaerolineaceae bacterium]